MTLNLDYDYLVTDTAIEQALQELQSYPVISLDTETTGLDPHTSQLLLLQLGTETKNLVIDMTKDHSLVTKDKTSQAWLLLKNIITGTAIKIGHNIGFDFKIIKAHFGYELRNMYCTMLAERILTAGIDSNYKYPSLKVVVPKYTELTEQDMKKEIRAGFYSGYIPSEFSKEQLEYSARDIAVLFPIYAQQVARLQETNMISIASLEFDNIAPIALMEYYGVNIAVDHWKQTIADLEEEQKKVRKEVLSYLKPLYKQKTIFDDFCPISLESPAQLLTAFRELGIEVESTSRSVLDKLQGDHPILKPFMVYRKLSKLITAFGEALLNNINPVTNRIHSNFKQIGADTGRMSSNNPNIQQIPNDAKFRKGFIAPKGFMCISADFSAQELRTVAYLSNEDNMLSAFNAGEDLHNKSTSLVYNIPMEEVNRTLASLDYKKEQRLFTEITAEEEALKKKRGICKSTNFLLVYGGGFSRLAAVAGISEPEAKQIMAMFFKAYPKLKAYIDTTGDRALKDLFSQTVMGRRRYYMLPPGNDPDYSRVEAAVRRQAVNHTIQGTCGDMLKLAIKFAHQDFCDYFGNENAYLALAVHDELVAMAKENIVVEAAKVLESAMERAFHCLIPRDVCPFKSDVNYAEFWVH